MADNEAASTSTVAGTAAPQEQVAAPETQVAQQEAGEQTQEQKDAAAEAARQAAKSYSQEEVDRITAKVKKNASYRARKEAEAYYKGLQQGTQVVRPEQQQAQAAEAPKEPKREDFEDYEAFLTARAEFRAERKVEERFAKERESQTQRSTQDSMEKLGENFVKQAEALAAEVDDFDEAMDTQVRMPDEMVRAVLETDIPARVAYHLAKNPDERDRIAALSSAKQALAIGRLEAKLLAEMPSGATATDGSQNGAANGTKATTASQASTTSTAVSKAPAPLKPVGGKATVGNEMPDPRTQPDAWYKWRQQQVAQRQAAARKA